jgi:membrane protease YdiL (CAAX protease family)
MTQSAVPVQRTRSRTVEVIATPAALVTASYLAALTIAEVTLLTSGLVAGALAHAILLVALIAHYMAAPRVGYRRLLLTLALPSLIRLIGLTVPVATTAPLLWIAAAGVPTLLAAILCARAIDAFPSAMLRWPGRDLGAQAAVAAGGLMHGMLAFLVLRPSPIIAQPNAVGVASAVLVLGVFAAFTEELIFRGIIQAVATEAFSSRAGGLLVSTTIFTVMYLGSMSLPFIVLMFAIGLFFGWIVQESGSLWGVIGAHALLSVGFLAVWPFLLR